MKTCLICDEKLGWVKFKSIDGTLCKKCYQIASRDFSEVIKNKTKSEILATFHQSTTLCQEKIFETTRKINQLVLFDDYNQKLCLPNHSKFSEGKQGPKIFSYTEIESCQLEEQHQQQQVKKKKLTLGTLKVYLQMGVSTHVIQLVPKPIDIHSSIYKTMKSLAQSIVKEVNQIVFQEV
ncbi:hypothetical protein [Enterococcus sp. AZ103]|uniref:hypothetical protein n=1 Tax=Enterococcus sp. AZ103 TaxID=2774628 RepID=UPI003F23BDF2